ncbi:MAG: hypothetical protein HWE27_09840 [Gammaproteobacteria bacterium]|nr:hypothetical protein [Gammaproteobacteria bacterium]
MYKVILVSVLVAGFSFDLKAEQPSYNFIEAGFSDYSTRLELQGNFEINDNFFGVAWYMDDYFDEFTAYSFGAGYKTAINNSSSFFAQAEYTDYSSELGPTEISSNGYDITMGVRSMVTKSTELSFDISNRNIESSTFTTVGVGVRQDFTDNFGGYIRYDINDFGGDAVGLGISVKF